MTIATARKITLEEFLVYDDGTEGLYLKILIEK